MPRDDLCMQAGMGQKSAGKKKIRKKELLVAVCLILTSSFGGQSFLVAGRLAA